MAAVWGIKTLLVSDVGIINDVVWTATDTVGNKVGRGAGVFKPSDNHPLKQKQWDEFSENQLIAFVKAGIGGQAVSKAERQAAINRSEQRLPKENYEVINREAVA